MITIGFIQNNIVAKKQWYTGTCHRHHFPQQQLLGGWGTLLARGTLKRGNKYIAEKEKWKQIYCGKVKSGSD